MKNPIHKNKVAQLKANRDVERKMALEKGDIWIRPTTYMDLRLCTTVTRRKRKPDR